MPNASTPDSFTQRLRLETEMPRTTTHPTERILGLFLDLPKAEQVTTLRTLNVLSRLEVRGAGAAASTQKRQAKPTAAHMVAAPHGRTGATVAQVVTPAGLIATPSLAHVKSPRQSKKDRLAEARQPQADVADPGLPPEEFGEPDAGDPVEG